MDNEIEIEGLKLKEFIQKRPDAAMYIMSPIGFVYIKHNANSDDLAAIRIPWGELQSHIIVRSTYERDKNTYYLTTDAGR